MFRDAKFSRTDIVYLRNALLDEAIEHGRVEVRTPGRRQAAEELVTLGYLYPGGDIPGGHWYGLVDRKGKA